MNIIERSAQTLAKASDGNPIITTAVIILFSILFTVFEASIEKLIFGERFEHFLDPFIAAGFIAYAAYAVYACAVFNER